MQSTSWNTHYPTFSTSMLPCAIKVVTNWSTWVLCQVALMSGTVRILLHTSSFQAPWCSWGEVAASLRTRNRSCWEIPQCITHHTPLALSTPPPHLPLHRFPLAPGWEGQLLNLGMWQSGTKGHCRAPLNGQKVRQKYKAHRKEERVKKSLTFRSHSWHSC